VRLGLVARNTSTGAPTGLGTTCPRINTQSDYGFFGRSRGTSQRWTTSQARVGLGHGPTVGDFRAGRARASARSTLDITGSTTERTDCSRVSGQVSRARAVSVTERTDGTRVSDRSKWNITASISERTDRSTGNHHAALDGFHGAKDLTRRSGTRGGSTRAAGTASSATVGQVDDHDASTRRPIRAWPRLPGLG
jgi:hypothetical protein